LIDEISRFTLIIIIVGIVGPRLHVKSEGRLYSRTSFIYKDKTSTLTPFVKPRDILNLSIQNVFYIQSYVESAFTYNPGSTLNQNTANTSNSFGLSFVFSRSFSPSVPSLLTFLTNELARQNE